MTKSVLTKARAALAAVVAFYSPSVQAEPDQSVQTEREAVNWLKEANLHPGFQLRVSKNGEEVLEENFGFADLSRRIPVSANHRFKVYSVSKTFTAVAALQLVEDQKLSLHEPISTYLTDLPAHLQPITAHQLLTHSSGIRHYNADEWFTVSFEDCSRPREALSPFLNDDLIATPGEGFHYSSFGYVLLSHLIETVSGRPFQVYMRERVFEKAAMEYTALDGLEVRTGPEATHYLRSPSHASGFQALYPEVNSSCKFGAGGFVSNAKDLVLFGKALLAGRLLGEASMELMTRKYFDWSETGSPAYGYGITPSTPPVPTSLPEGLSPDDVPQLVSSLLIGFGGMEFGTVIHNNGSAAGAYALLVIFPESGTVAAFAANSRGVDGVDAFIPVMATAKFIEGKTP